MVLFQVNAVYDRQTGEDIPGKVKEIYLVEAPDCADAQQQVIENIKPFIFGECDIPQVRKRNFFDILHGDGENWYEAKVEMITIDGDKETRKAVTILVQENTISQALQSLKLNLGKYDCEIVSIKKSAVLDIIE